jgi:hypothetical protein
MSIQQPLSDMALRQAYLGAVLRDRRGEIVDDLEALADEVIRRDARRPGTLRAAPTVTTTSTSAGGGTMFDRMATSYASGELGGEPMSLGDARARVLRSYPAAEFTSGAPAPTTRRAAAGTSTGQPIWRSQMAGGENMREMPPPAGVGTPVAVHGHDGTVLRGEVQQADVDFAATNRGFSPQSAAGARLRIQYKNGANAPSAAHENFFAACKRGGK